MKNDKSRKMVIAFYIYWIMLVIWQNFLSYTNEGVSSLVIKLGFLIYLVVEMSSIRMRINRNYALVWTLFAILMIQLLFTKDTINGATIIYYAFPVIFTFLVYVCNYNTNIHINDYVFFLKLFILSVFFMALYTVVFQGNQLINLSSLTSAYGNEIKSFFISSHEYGMYLTFGITSIVILLLKEEQSFFSIVLYVFLLLLFGVNLIATISRTAILSCVVMLTIVVFLSKKNFVKKIAIAIAILFVILLVMSPRFISFINTVVLKGGNDAGRLIMWSRSWQYFKELSLFEKILGNGISNVTAYVGNTYSHSSLHNAFLQTLLVSGILGDLFLILFIVESIFKSIRIYSIDKNYCAIFVSLTFMAVAFMLTNTACIMQSPIDSFMLTIYCIVIPRFVSNEILLEKG